MKTIKDAVIELSGKLPRINNTVNGYSVHGKNLFYLNVNFIGTDDQFKSEAKRLGYINGYLWGVEYPTNGKRPDLADDVLVQLTLNSFNINHEKVETANWSGSFKFKITDQRFKPANEASEAEKLGIMPPMNKSERCDLNSWHERGELPPVGVVCNYRKGAHQSYRWRTGEIKYISKFITVVRDIEDSMDVSLNTASNLFKTIRTEREKVIEAAEKAMLTSRVSNTQRKTIKRLYDLGMLVLAPKKSDTED